MNEKPMKRKFFETDQQTDPTLSTGPVEDGETTVECPVHKQKLQIQTENREVEGKTVFVKFAVCNCNVPDNQHLGKRVWEQT